MEILALSLLILLSVVGFAAIFFNAFGTLIILIGSLVYSYMTGFFVLTPRVLLILILLYLCGEVFEYVLVIVGAKKFGASNRAVVGALAGAFIGAFIGVQFLGIGIIFGMLFGIFFGAFTVEYLIQRDLVKSLKAGVGGLAGHLGSILVKAIIAVVMFAIMFSRIRAFI